MSHIATIELEVNDLESLSRACQRMGLKLVRGKKTYKWYYGDNTCDHAIVVPGANYEIGIHHKEGKYNLETDFWDQMGLKQRLVKMGGYSSNGMLWKELKQRPSGKVTGLLKNKMIITSGCMSGCKGEYERNYC